MDYGEALGRAWKIFWKHKILWLFGFLYGGWAGVLYIPSTLLGFYMPGFMQSLEGMNSAQIDAQMKSLFVYLLIFVAVILIFVILALLLQTFGWTGLVHGTQKADEGAGKIGAGELFQAGKANFWRVLGTVVLLSIALQVVVGIFYFLIVGLSLVTFGLALICLLPFFLLLIPLSYFFRAYMELTVAAQVIERPGIGGGLQRGWFIIRNRFVPVLVMALILIIGQSVASLIFAAPYFLVSWSLSLFQFSRGLALAPTIIGLLYTPVYTFAISLVMAYSVSAWALTFLRLTRPPAAEKPLLVANA